MRHGSSQEFTNAGVLNFLSFDEYALDLSPFLSKDEEVHFKTSDRFLHELVFPDLTQPWERQYRGKMLSEANARVASPLYSIAFMAIALAAIVGGSFSRFGYNGPIASASALAALARILGFAFQALAIHSPWLNLMQYLAPIGATAIALAIVFRAPVARRPATRWARLTAYAGAGA